MTSTIKTKDFVAFGSGGFAFFFIRYGVSVLAIPYYQMILGVDPFILSLAITIPLILSAVIGTWVGYLSDHFQSKWGRRKPFIVCSAIISGILYGLLWMAPQDWTTQQQLYYFSVLSGLFHIASTFFTIPYACLCFDISQEPAKRTKVMAINAFMGKIASVTYQWAFPISQLAIFGSIYTGVYMVGWFIGILFILIFGLLPALLISEADIKFPIKTKLTGRSFFSDLQLTLKNRAFTFLLIIVFAQFFGGAYSASFDYYLIVYYMNAGDIAEGALWKGLLSSSYATMGAIAVPIIVYSVFQLGKIKTLQLIFLLTIVGGITKWFIYTPGVYWLLIVDAVLCAFVWASMGIILQTLVADLCDESAQISNRDSKGVFVSVNTLVTQLSASLALLVSGLTLNFIGFDATLGPEQSESSLLSMRIVLSGGTVLFSLIALTVLTKFRQLKNDKKITI